MTAPGSSKRLLGERKDMSSTSRLSVLAILAAIVLIPGTIASADPRDPKCPNPAGNYPPGQCKRLRVSTSLVVAGSDITVSGDGFAPAVTVEISLRSQPTRLANVTTDSAGMFSEKVAIPSNAPLGHQQLRALGPGSDGQPLLLTADISIRRADGDGRHQNRAPASRNSDRANDDASASLAAAHREAERPSPGVLLPVLLGVGLAVSAALVMLARRRVKHQ